MVLMKNIVCRFRFEKRMKTALCALEHGMGYRAASKQFNVPRTTLTRRHRKNTQSRLRPGAPQLLSCEEEKRLKEWIVGCAARGYPLRSHQIIVEASALLEKRTEQNRKLLSM